MGSPIGQVVGAFCVAYPVRTFEYAKIPDHGLWLVVLKDSSTDVYLA